MRRPWGGWGFVAKPVIKGYATMETEEESDLFIIPAPPDGRPAVIGRNWDTGITIRWCVKP